MVDVGLKFPNQTPTGLPQRPQQLKLELVMPAYAQIITHIPEKTLQWREIVTSNPGRLVRTIALRPGHTTSLREGDHQGAKCGREQSLGRPCKCWIGGGVMQECLRDESRRFAYGGLVKSLGQVAWIS